MNGYVIVFLAAMMLVFSSPILPSLWVLCCILATTLCVAAKRARYLVVFLAGLIWAGWHGEVFVSRTLAPEFYGVDLQIIGRITDIPRQNGQVTRFHLQVERIVTPDYPSPFPKHLRLSWYQHAPPLRLGDVWTFSVRLKPNRGLMNPGGFDLERWLFSQGIHASGYVRDKLPFTRHDSHPHWQHRWRDAVLQRLEAASLPPVVLAMSRALVLGDGGGLSRDQRQAFRLTGTSHLLVISGLHVSLVAMFCWGLGALLWRAVAWFWPPPLSREWMAAGVSLIGACLYASVAGFTVPVLRALIMLLVYLWYRCGRRHMPFSHPYFIALLCVLLLQPLSPMGAGFWLSFGAVAVIYFLLTRLRFVVSSVWHWLGWHALLSVGLMPLSVLFFGFWSPLTMVANAYAVPLVSLVVVPAVLVGVVALMLWENAGAWILSVIGSVFSGLLSSLQWLATQTDLHYWVAGASGLGIGLLMLAVFVALLPPAMRLTGLAVPLAAMVFWPDPERPPAGDFDVSVIDVGQGLAVLVETQSHRLLFDTGGRFSRHFSVAAVSVVPYLRHRGVSRLDTVVISHPDSDHAAGLAAVRDAVAVDSVVTHAVFDDRVDADAHCRRGDTWDWDGVRFTFINRSDPAYAGTNDHSCVLLIESGVSRVLLPGDIERPAEDELLASGIRGPLSLIVAPHHGSRSSSTPAFVDALRPHAVVYAAGFANRFGFPHAAVQARYRAIGAEAYRSDADGLVRFAFTPQGQRGGATRYRDAHVQFWRADFDL
ncbi:MAG TPA: DNA internalization-related competence protein ComEC/Rec2 [Gammaproteobacteria bacterium]|nr:DNA internalization-related competence protein ComEC/Rec2 [Gammaproteobacteria bacterium]